MGMIKLCVYLIVCYFIDKIDANKHLPKYSSFQCIGGSQVLNSESLKQATVYNFPLNNAEHRTCLMKNVCLLDGELTYFVSQELQTSVPEDYQLNGFHGSMFHTGHLRGFTLPFKTVNHSIPSDYSFTDSTISFLDANSFSFNYGHYLIDNVITAFAAAKIFNVPFVDTQQVFETNCVRFANLDDAYTNRLITFNRSMGTYRQACLEKLDGMYSHFFDYPPIYIDQSKGKNMCFRRLMVGQGSTFGLKSVDLSRPIYMREFRDFVLRRIYAQKHISPPPQENMILVGLRTVGAAGGALINDLCAQVTNAFSHIPVYNTTFVVKCIVPSAMSFEDEIFHAQRAKIIVTMHGTISYLSLFSRDGTQQLSIAHPKEFKENQILLYSTHFQTLYLNWDEMHKLSGILHHQLFLSDQGENV
jgi:hypothetical protein